MSPLMPIATAAAASLAREAVAAIGSGLSFAAELVRQDQATQPARAGGPPAARAQLAHSLQQFAGRLRHRLVQAGLSLAGTIELAADGLGGIEVGGSHPHKAAIEELLAADESLVAHFRSLAEQSALLTGDSRHHFRLLIDEDGAEPIPE
jgi:hypothetical protein